MAIQIDAFDMDQIPLAMSLYRMASAFKKSEIAMKQIMKTLAAVLAAMLILVLGSLVTVDSATAAPVTVHGDIDPR